MSRREAALGDDVLARRVEAAQAAHDAHYDYQPHLRPDKVVTNTLAASDAVLREAGQRVWWCDGWNEDGRHVGWGVSGDGLHGCRPDEPIAHTDRCGWVYTIPADALAGEDDQ